MNIYTMHLIKSLGIRILIGTVVFVAVITLFCFLGRQLAIGFPFFAVYIIFILVFLIAGKEIYFGFGNPTFRRICSYFIAAGCAWVALYALWNIADMS